MEKKSLGKIEEERELQHKTVLFTLNNWFLTTALEVPVIIRGFHESQVEIEVKRLPQDTLSTKSRAGIQPNLFDFNTSN